MQEGPQTARVIRFGPFEADLHTRELRKQGIRIKLQDQPFHILAMLLRSPGELVTREQIRTNLWPQDTFVDFDHGLNAAVRRLRDALNDSADTPRFIETLPRRGYRFIGHIEFEAQSVARVAAAEACAPVELSAAPGSRQPAMLSAAPQPEANRPLLPWWRRYPLAMTVTGVLISGAALLAWALSRTPAINSIAILPFANETHEAGLDYLSDGITETIINNLAQVPTLEVTSRNAAFVYKGRAADPKAIAHELGVRAVLVGNLSAVAPAPGASREAHSVRLAIELVDTQHDRRLWGEQYTIKSVESNEVLAQISDRVAEKLALRLSSAVRSRVARRHTENNAAFDAYLHGMFAINQRAGIDEYRQALGYFREARALDRNYAPAYTGEAAALGLLAFYGGMAPWEAYPLQEKITLRALELDPELADAHVQYGYLLQQPLHRDMAGAEREFRLALQLQPYSGQAHHALALHLSIIGRTDESLAEARRAAELEPSLPPSKGTILWMEYFGHRFAEMERSFREFAPGHLYPHCMEALYFEAVGRYAQAMAEIEQVTNLAPGNVCSLPHVYAVSGRQADARTIVAGMIADRSKGYVSAYQIALVYAGLGETEAMLHWLQLADKELDPWLIWLKSDPRFDSYRALPEFAALEQQVFTPR
ncbi:MAG: winged helix-turn-helix domain-containing protein [Acidobacteria bacterium]|nr:winged helix-turn-helix domain-containing protein [Acidobacteriota bacterium]